MSPARALLIAASLGSTAAHAHLGDLVYPAFELPPGQLPNLHDGTLEDWEAALPHTSLTHGDFLTVQGDTMPLRQRTTASVDRPAGGDPLTALGRIRLSCRRTPKEEDAS